MTRLSLARWYGADAGPGIAANAARTGARSRAVDRAGLPEAGDALSARVRLLAANVTRGGVAIDRASAGASCIAADVAGATATRDGSGACARAHTVDDAGAGARAIDRRRAGPRARAGHSARNARGTGERSCARARGHTCHHAGARRITGAQARFDAEGWTHFGGIYGPRVMCVHARVDWGRRVGCVVAARPRIIHWVCLGGLGRQHCVVVHDERARARQAARSRDRRQQEQPEPWESEAPHAPVRASTTHAVTNPRESRARISTPATLSPRSRPNAPPHRCTLARVVQRFLGRCSAFSRLRSASR